MRRLSFKKVYVEPILDGRKTSTLRRATKIEAGDTVALTCQWGAPPFAYVTATRVREVSASEIDDALARAEGYEFAEDLLRDLHRLYPDRLHFVAIDFAVA